MKEIKTSNMNFLSIGPDLSQNVKTVLYFSLSAKESLDAKPFCNPSHHLKDLGCRVLSVTLPFHEDDKRPADIKSLWGDNISIIHTFLDQLVESVQELRPMLGDRIGVAGLSRGAFIATHLGARLPWISTILGFAPMSHLHNNPEMDLATLSEILVEKSIRYYIGHDDTLVGTERILNTVNQFIDTAQSKKIQSPDISLCIRPSVGQHGHGTLNPTFEDGATWIAKNL